MTMTICGFFVYLLVGHATYSLLSKTDSKKARIYAMEIDVDSQSKYYVFVILVRINRKITFG